MPKNNPPLPQNLLQLVLTDWRYFVGFGFGSGLLPKAPGTWGSLFAIPLIIVLNLFPLWSQISFILIYFLIGAYVSDVLSKSLGIHDYAGINCDEFLGMMVLMLPFQINMLNLSLGFLFFRFFDILKPFPVGWIDRNVHGGIGMMLDDVFAAFLSMILLYIVHLWI